MKKKEKFKFAVGDRVVYRCRGFGGNGSLHNEVGTVKRVEKVNGHVDYDVEFDRAFEPSMDLAHFGIKRGHGWSCLEEHLEKEGSEEKDEDPDIKKTRERRGNYYGKEN